MKMHVRQHASQPARAVEKAQNGPCKSSMHGIHTRGNPAISLKEVISSIEDTSADQPTFHCTHACNRYWRLTTQLSNSCPQLHAPPVVPQLPLRASPLYNHNSPSTPPPPFPSPDPTSDFASTKTNPPQLMSYLRPRTINLLSEAWVQNCPSRGFGSSLSLKRTRYAEGRVGRVDGRKSEDSAKR